MGMQIKTDLLQEFFLPLLERSTAPKPRVMPQKIVDRIINATTERELAEAWVSPQTTTPLRCLTVRAGRVVEPNHQEREWAMSWLPPWAIAGPMGSGRRGEVEGGWGVLRGVRAS